MKFSTHTVVVLLSVFLISCTVDRKLYYESPLTATTNFYYTQPRLSDSIKSAYYANLSIYGGNANYKLLDGVNFSNYMLYKTGNIKSFQYYIGGNFLFGDYQHDTLNESYFINNTIPFKESKNTFRAFGLHGGICYTIPRKNFEWRALGLEYSYAKEFGDYATFRNSLKDSMVQGNIKDNYLHTLGISTEIVSKQKNWGIGIKSSFGYILNNRYLNPVYTDKTSTEPYYYYTLAFSVTYKKYSLYQQLNLGKFSSGVTFGATYRF